MARDRIFSSQRRRRPRVAWWLLLLVLVPAVFFLRPISGRVDPTIQAQAVLDVDVPSRPVPPAPSLSAKSYILMDADTGVILAQKNTHERLPMASTTKMMTAALVLERANLDDVVAASKHAGNTPYSGLYLKEGEKVTVRDLLWGVMLRSANDACVALGEHVAGSEEAFVAMMNARAAEWGLKDTQFKNPHGLHAEGHYSSAYDLAEIARHGMRHPVFAEMSARKAKRIDRSIEKQDIVVVNKNRLLYRWPLADGIKTGYTRQAGHCLVASASKENWRLISVVLRSGDSWGESRQLLEYGMRAYQRVVVAPKGTRVAPIEIAGGRVKRVDAVLDRDVAVVTPRGTTVDSRTDAKPGRMVAPLAAGVEAGTLVLRQGDKTLAQVRLVTDATAEELPPRFTSAHLAGGVGALSGLLFLMAVARYGRKTSQGPGRRRGRFTP